MFAERREQGCHQLILQIQCLCCKQMLCSLVTPNVSTSWEVCKPCVHKNYTLLSTIICREPCRHLSKANLYKMFLIRTPSCITSALLHSLTQPSKTTFFGCQGYGWLGSLQKVMTARLRDLRFSTLPIQGIWILQLFPL